MSTTTHPATLALTLDPTTWSTQWLQQHPRLLLTLGRQLRVAGYRLDPADLTAALLNDGQADATDACGQRVAVRMRLALQLDVEQAA
ncbi:hypothetical protein F7Q92_16310 [Ideonella dechloratans]|uniref:Uncharacterized protein n=1 Tax=Ideonella dechloratans TaxID=36863 RepID=A0A643F8N2_IDEDE|nr:hypothetical protein [Ideonella dechloratans]KAB0577485.1 hypothetical protein F7Q92_16310 [Ideonella dechloratans]UFU10016.1 hypothetical protein LRM40_17230 [Ideonella dechloratans]